MKQAPHRPNRLIVLVNCLALAGIALLLISAKGQQATETPKAKVMNPHGPINIPCQNCHTYTSWKPIRGIPEFNHSQTSYPLVGMHRQVPCMRCHTSLAFSKVSETCSQCHADIHRGQFGSDCAKCHSVKGWNVTMKQIQDHANRFPLIGAHALLDCVACHTGAATGQYTGLSTECYSCHQKDYLTPVINHVTAKFPITCQTCHTMDSWFGAAFDHFKYTGYALTGMHATLACTACHINNVYQGTPSDCYSCHKADYNKTNNPNHLTAGFPTDCSVCHSTAGWIPASFNHNNTSFPLTGAHKSVPCATCHVNNNYTTLPTTCSGCHMKDYNNTNNPNHASAGFPTTCDVCHSTTAWSPASFNHNNTPFPLTGAHVSVPCAQCHINNVYAGTPTACYACHSAQYNSTTNPNHITAGFPTTCQVCHNTTSWSGATFNHTWFDMNHGGANGVCSTCHTNANDYSVFTCTNCHTKAKTDNQHQGVSGYVYNSVNCYACHANAGGGGGGAIHANSVHVRRGL